MDLKKGPPNYALVEMYSDGFVQVFGDNSLRCEIFNRPHVRTIGGGQLVDELINSFLPDCYRQIYFTGMVRKTGFLCKITPRRIHQLVTDDIRALNAFGGTDRLKGIVMRKTSSPNC